MKLEHVVSVILAVILATGAASAVESAVNETELFIIGFDIAEGSSEEASLKDMAEEMGGAYVSAEDATTAADLEIALTESFAGIHRGDIEKVPLLEIRGPIATVEDGAVYTYAFYYDIDDNLGTEKITMTITGDVLDEPEGVVYETVAQEDDFDFDEWGDYMTIGFLAEVYFAAYVENEDDPMAAYLADDSTDVNLMEDEQLTKVLINDDKERTITTGTPLALADGYELVIQEIDVDNNWVYVQLMKNGAVIDTDVVEPSKDGATIEDKTYTYKKDLGNTKDIVVIAVHFKNAIHLKSGGQDFATIDGIWQISEDPIDIEEDTEYDKMTIQSVNSEDYSIMMNNEDNKIILSKDKDILLMSDIRIKTADQEATAEDPLRFYLAKTITEPGYYEIQGTVAEVVDGATVEWDASSFAGFYYDIDDNLGTEKITMRITGDALEEPEGVVYETWAQWDDFDFDVWGHYMTIGFLAEEYFAAYIEKDDPMTAYLADDSTDINLMADEQLTKVLINDDEERAITTGTPLTLADGYELVIQEIDVDNNWVYVQLMKNGTLIDTDLVEPSKDGATIEDKTYTYKKDLGDTKDIVVIAIHFKNAIHLKSGDQDLATIDGIWQISEMPIDIEEDTEYDKMTIQSVNYYSILMNNEDNKIILSKDKDILLMSDIRIKTADQDMITAEEPLRFYIYKEVTVEPQDSTACEVSATTPAADAAIVSIVGYRRDVEASASASGNFIPGPDPSLYASDAAYRDSVAELAAEGYTVTGVRLDRSSKEISRTGASVGNVLYIDGLLHYHLTAAV
jgi:S-layer protein (TIGR01567 family)